MHSVRPQDQQKSLMRLLSSTDMKTFCKRWSSKLNYLGWELLFGGVLDAVFIPFSEKHAALEKSDRLLKDIAVAADELVTLLGEYQSASCNANVDSLYLSLDLITGLRGLSLSAKGHSHIRLGVGKEAWGKRTQNAGDGLPQFVRYLDDRIAFYRTSGSTTGGLDALSAGDIARLAIPVLNLGDDDNDRIGKVTARVKSLRKTG
jgi:hypothetical protein